MIWGALRLLGSMPKPQGIPASEAKPTPVHAGVAWLIVIVSVLAIGIMLFTGLNFAALVIIPIAFSVLILGSLFVRGVQEASGQGKQINSTPPISIPETQLYNAQRLRARAKQIQTTMPPVLAQHQRLSSPPVVHEPPAVPKPRPAPNVVLGKDLRNDRDLHERMMRIARILIAPCPVCKAGEAEFCTFVPDINVYLLDRQRSIVVHGARIGNAIKLHTTDVDDVTAQFEGKVPDDVWETAL